MSEAYQPISYVNKVFKKQDYLDNSKDALNIITYIILCKLDN